MFRPNDYRRKVQALGRNVAMNLEIDFVSCKWSGDNFTFIGVFRYKGVETEIILATRKELEDGTLREDNIEKKLHSWKINLDRNNSN